GREGLPLGQVPAGEAVDDVGPGAQHRPGGRLAGGDGLVGAVGHVGAGVRAHVGEVAGDAARPGPFGPGPVGRGPVGRGLVRRGPVHESPPGISRVSSTSPSLTVPVPTGTTTRASAAAYPPIRCEDGPPTRRTRPEGSTRARRYCSR